MRERTARIIRYEQGRTGRATHALEVVTVVLGVLTLPLLLVQRANPTHAMRDATVAAEWSIWLWFALELILMLWLAERRKALLRAHWFDVAVTLGCVPVGFVGFGSLRAVRAARALRGWRVGHTLLIGGKVVRAERRFTSAHGLAYAAGLAAVLIIGGGYAISVVEPTTFPGPSTGIWWALVTVTTVGYGDYAPRGAAGRLLAGVLMLVGIGFLSVLTAAIASKFIDWDSDDDDATRDTEIAHMRTSLERIEVKLALLLEHHPPRDADQAPK